jgi:anthranilate synthase component 2
MVELARQIENQAPFIPGKQKILFINNQDSFVYNLVNYICMCSEAEVTVVTNTISLSKVKKLKPDKDIHKS